VASVHLSVRSFVHPSVSIWRKLLLPDKCLDRDQTCTRWSQGKPASRCVLKVKVKGHMIPAHLEFHRNHFFLWANGCILIKLISTATSPSLCPFGFLLHPSSHMAVGCAAAYIVKQFVKLFAIQYGLTFGLYVHSLYEAPLHCPSRLSIRQLDLMSNSSNELLRH